MVNDRSVRGSVRGGCGVKFVPTYKYVMHNLTVNSSTYGYINSSAVGDRQSNSNALVRVPVIYMLTETQLGKLPLLTPHSLYLR